MVVDRRPLRPRAAFQRFEGSVVLKFLQCQCVYPSGTRSEARRAVPRTQYLSFHMNSYISTL